MNGANLLDDISDKWGPMLVREIRQGLRAKIFVISFIALQVAMILALSFDHFNPSFLFFFLLADSSFGQPHQGGFWFVAFVIFFLVIPSRGLGAISSEIQDRNGELLLFTKLTRWKIVWQKWMALNALTIIAMISSIPYLVARYYFGGMDVIATLTAGAFTFWGAMLCNAFALSLSSFRIVPRILMLTFFPLIIGVGIAIISYSNWIVYSSIFQKETILANVLVAMLSIIPIAYYCYCFLQIASTRLRSLEAPYHQSTAANLIFIVILSPFYFTIAFFLTLGLGVGVIALFFTIAVARIDQITSTSREQSVPFLAG